MSDGRKGEKATNWKGGRYVDSNGYAWLRKTDHPRAKAGGYVREHHLVVEQALGRLLVKGETVHHINGKRDDNRIENLQLCATRHGKGQAMVCADCGSKNIVHQKLGRFGGVD